MVSRTQRDVKLWCWLVAAATLAVVALGLVNLASIGSAPGHGTSLWPRQLLFSVAGLGLGLAAALLGPRRLTRWALLPYGLGLAAALAVALGLGVVARGASQWIALPGARLHVGTLVQFGLIAALAWCIGRVVQLESTRRWLFGLALPLGIVLVPFVLLVRQPDMVSALIVLVVAIIMLALELRTLVAAIVLSALGTLAPFFLWFFVFAAYQRQRIAAFLAPADDPAGAGYLSSTSVKIFTSGQLGGQGWGSAGHLEGYLPDAHTTGVLAVWGHEWGTLGVAVLLGLLLLIALGLLMVARRLEQRCGAAFAAGAAAWLLVQAALHTGSTIGLIPYLGAKLPLVSYSGSGSLLTLAAIGFVVGLGLRRRISSQPLLTGSLAQASRDRRPGKASNVSS